MDRKIFKSTHFCNRINVFQKLYSAGDHYSLLLVGMILCSIIIWSSYSKGLWAENATQGNNKESEGRIMGKYSAFNSYILHVVAELQCVKRLPEEVEVEWGERGHCLCILKCEAIPRLRGQPRSVMQIYYLKDRRSCFIRYVLFFR